MTEELAKYEGKPVVHLDESIIKKYICPQATDQEIYMFLQLCKGQQLNPFLREVYLIKYGSQPASIVTGKDTFIKRARSIPAYKGFRAGIVVLNPKNKLTYREGGIVLKGESLIGGWAEVFRNDCEAPVRSEVDYDEYVGKKQDGSTNRQWAEKPATMIRKVALVQAHREAFPDQFEGMYSPEEMGVEVDNIEYKQDKPAEGYKQQPQSKSEQKEASTEKDLRAEITRMINEMDTTGTEFELMLKTFSGFQGKHKETGESQWVEGKSRVEELSDAAVKVTYGKIKKAYEKHLEGQKNNA